MINYLKSFYFPIYNWIISIEYIFLLIVYVVGKEYSNHLISLFLSNNSACHSSFWHSTFNARRLFILWIRSSIFVQFVTRINKTPHWLPRDERAKLIHCSSLSHDASFDGILLRKYNLQIERLVFFLKISFIVNEFVKFKAYKWDVWSSKICKWDESFELLNDTLREINRSSFGINELK